MSKIIRLSSTNYKRLKAVEITPEGNVITIAGKNGAGKSSVLDSITAALGGVDKKATPKPIRDGEDHAEIVLETEDLIVTRRFTASGSTLTVTSRDGAKYPKGQQKLNDLLGKLSLDPLAFTQLSEKDQLETLLSLVDLPFDPAELEAERKRIYDQRTEIGRQSKAIGDVAVDEGLPTEEQSAVQILNQIENVRDRNRQIERIADEVVSYQDERRNVVAQIQALQERLELIDQAQRDAQAKAAHLGDVQDTTDLEAQLASVEDTNAAIRANNVAREKAEQKAELKRSWDALTSTLDVLNERKADGLASAEMPVPGLGFDENGVTFEGIPFKQTNTASQIRVSLAMAMALNPGLRVIRIAEGSLLDEDNLKIVADMAAEHDYQVWMEVVGNGDGTGIIIEDGEVKA
ncbi:AAA family ATPase [Citricoccus sp. NR2]|uniref:AAA family ATPase n=1 Tax=Citricoccus sp. NR2 TaxID=3004095 RepID=UPI0022DE13F7|nr:AAA family ATPase [Citricoccus sp. NR2]WBL18477.1 AAA family ATPase [Citricoccus sp. NR2]